ncbi:LysR substrate-binding domain-containing protein [Shinella sp. BYT-45]|uniref:LysR substrate-binding domain-containing protein n=1 Tax=Shinella sp. BYT-45 TaxID=3377377 RepID=UPI00397FF272
MVTARLEPWPDKNEGHIFQDTLALQQAAIRGHGVALYARELAEAALSRGDLVVLFPDVEVSTAGQYYLITKHGKPSPPAQDFICWLHGQVAAKNPVALMACAVSPALRNPPATSRCRLRRRSPPDVGLWRCRESVALPGCA